MLGFESGPFRTNTLIFYIKRGYYKYSSISQEDGFTTKGVPQYSNLPTVRTSWRVKKTSLPETTRQVRKQFFFRKTVVQHFAIFRESQPANEKEGSVRPVGYFLFLSAQANIYLAWLKHSSPNLNSSCTRMIGEGCTEAFAHMGVKFSASFFHQS